MTWNWKWSLAATGATAMAGWLATPPVETGGAGRADSSAVTAQSEVGPAAVAEIQEQARRLSTRLAPRPIGPTPERNPFQFGARPAARRAPAVTARPAEPPPPQVEVPAPFPLQLTGIAVDTIDGVETRTAIISGPSGLELAKVGDAAAPGYRVVTVGDSFAEVERLSDGTRERLVLAR
jgi:hypothetical protein